MNAVSHSDRIVKPVKPSGAVLPSVFRGAFAGAGMLFGASLCVQLALFGMPFEAMVLSIVLGVLGGFIAGVFNSSIMASQRVFMGSLICLAASFILGIKGVMAVWANVANGFIVAWDVTTKSYVLPLRIDESLSLLDMVAIGLCISAVTTLVVWALLRLQKSALVIVVALLVVLSAVFCGKATFVSVAFVLGAGVLLASVMAMRGYRPTNLSGNGGSRVDEPYSDDLRSDDLRSAGSHSTGSRSKSLRSDNMRLASDGLSSIMVPLCIALLVSICFGLGLAGSVGDRPQASSLRADVMQAIDESRFGTDTLPEGNFLKAYRMNQTEDPSVVRLEVDFEDSEAIEQSYFRGYVGSVYNGRSFEQESFSAYDGQWNGLFEWIEREGFDPMTQSASYARLDSRIGGWRASESTLSIKARDANRRYSYVPYQAISDDETTPLLDMYLQPSGFFGLDEESVGVVLDSQASEFFSPASWISASSGDDAANGGGNGDIAGGDASGSGSADSESVERGFIQSERAYRSFVYDTYLDGYDGIDDAIRKFFFSGEGWDPSTKDLYSIATRVRSMLESHCSYTVEPSAFQASVDADYVKWFLETEKQGNSSAFAASAVLAFREAGVPARYVEGYLLGQADVDALQDAGQTDVRLTSREAHAWAEVYIDGVGWTPMEMTPGFYDKTYTAEQTIEISKEVAGDGSDSELSGNLDRSWDDWIPEELRPFAWIGLLLLIVIILFAIFGLLELQRYIRIRARQRAFDAAVERAMRAGRDSRSGRFGRLEDGRPDSLTEIGDTSLSEMLFLRMKKAMRFAPVPFDADRPMDYKESIGLWTSDVSADEYARVIELIERERFGAIGLNPHEAQLVERIVLRLEAEVWQGATRRRRLLLRYGYLFELPL